MRGRGRRDELKGEVPLGLVVLKAGASRDRRSWWRSWSSWCASGSGRSRRFKTATVVKRLPKTRSGKIVRGTIKKIADGVAYTVPPTIDDPAILDEISADLAAIGYPRGRNVGYAPRLRHASPRFIFRSSA